ncbi:tRNA methyltransferase, has a role in tRNA modification [Scheffersomyces xylosifermentans]|uniref:tRNA methyltransferase, has a role in tRNA modification n=1 Tax=Scheffersomyces xylosifermentans TaxID=1304137 RepID=UPI00315D4192
MSVPSVPISKDIDPRNQEEDYVHSVYNDIATHFSQTRYKPWPIVEKFLKTREDYSTGIDVGCGNGKYLGVNKKLYIIGTDRSDGLISCAHDISKGAYNLGVADGLNLPHPEGTFDFAISIAVIHHFATEERRSEAIAHIVSKLKTGGELLIYCWALEQENSRRGYKEGDEQDILIPWVLQKKQPRKPKTRKNRKKSGNEVCKEEEDAEKETEIETPDESPVKESETKYRYYHLYKQGELAANALSTGTCTILEEGYEKDNWWIIVKKI